MTSKKDIIFFNYSTRDNERFQIREIAELLEESPNVEKTFYWEEDSRQNIVEWMEESLLKSNILLAFCTENAFKSAAFNDEWQAAYQLRKKGLMDIIPIYENVDYIPKLLRPLLNLKFTKNLPEFIANLNREISSVSDYKFIDEILKIAKIYSEISLEKLAGKLDINIDMLEEILGHLISEDELKAKIRRDIVIFEDQLINQYEALQKKYDQEIKELQSKTSSQRYAKKESDSRIPIPYLAQASNDVDPSMLTVFISYSTEDSEYWDIPAIANYLEEKPEIRKAVYWERDSGGKITEYMERWLSLCKVFILFCSENAKKSSSVNDEWQAAYQLTKVKRIQKIIPVYENENYIPSLLLIWLNIRFTKDNPLDFNEKVYKEILRNIES